MDVMIDLVALGKGPGSAITELAAVGFNIETGELLSSFSRIIDPEPDSPPFTCDLDTLEWHKKNDSWPRFHRDPEVEVRITEALRDFKIWYYGLESVEPVETVWSWGWDYDHPILDAAFALTGSGPLPWRYHRGVCARSVWRGVFPTVKRPSRPHTAVDDARAAVGDLRLALSQVVNVSPSSYRNPIRTPGPPPFE